MAFKITSTTVNTAVATNGTISFPYPSGTAAADFALTGAKLAPRDLQSVLTQAADTFTISYGGSTIDVTYKGATTIPAGCFCTLQAPLSALSAVTENAGAVGGTNDGNLPDLTATAAAVTDSTTGTPDTVAPIALAAVTNPTLTWDGLTDPSAAQATAINAAITALKNNQATQSDQYDAMLVDLAALRAAVRELATKLNTLLAVESADLQT